MSVIIPRRAGKVNIRLARSRSEDIFAPCTRALSSSTSWSWYVGIQTRESAAEGYEKGSDKREDTEDEGAGTRKQTFLCMYSHDSPMHTAASARTAIAPVYTYECVRMRVLQRDCTRAYTESRRSRYSR